MAESALMIAWLGLALAVSALLTGLVRRYALAGGMLDVPNARSSHSLPTPRGGGLAIVLVTLAGLVWLYRQGLMAGSVFTALAGAGVLVAAVGWFDDRGHVAARWRLLVHFVAAGWGLAWLGGLPSFELFGVVLEPGVPGFCLGLLCLVWLLNLYNFMDGIDGIAGVEVVSVCAGACWLGWLAGVAPVELLPPALLAAASLGFLCWNWPPARIFMGDAGSGFIGLMLGLLSVLAAHQSLLLFAGWLILLAVFVCDASVTLLRRLVRGQHLAQAHCSHAYQQAARRCASHSAVTLSVLAINLCWLLPLASLAVLGMLAPVFGLVLAYAPLIFLALCLRAGVADPAVSTPNPPKQTTGP
ncbi:MraY family glycosyltransferase [Marinobacterium rhizophilum]|uniref:Glycosyltransferase family 4 protein n=1 Tax=Marinobacterium rhizophilum TaxID=420402 RepID=A0ABY5HQJ2_9GAMM|nr:glycosyltransferase family 4 protein [Marinobacterium rhizophilum]UTW14249.1 glycosyltransferase family 4 protein [Marinobacterium rhizophilum]